MAFVNQNEYRFLRIIFTFIKSTHPEDNNNKVQPNILQAYRNCWTVSAAAERRTEERTAADSLEEDNLAGGNLAADILAADSPGEDTHPLIRCLIGSSYFEDNMYSVIRFVLAFVIISTTSLQASSDGDTSHVENYITKTYFEKYDSLVDSQFSNFIRNDIPLGLSKVLQDESHVLPTVVVLKRNIVGEGSHRILSSSIRIKFQPDIISELTAHSCSLTVIEKLPLGVFADPFELQHLVHRGVFVGASVFGDTNLELPSFRSNRSVVEVHMSIDYSVISDDLEVNINLPLHARYPPLGFGFSKVEFGLPDILMCCVVEEKVINHRCLFMPVSFSSYNNKDSLVIWEIPCGSKEHAKVVSAVTFGSTIVAAFVIIVASICYENRTISNKLKHS